jgi:selenocysteine lyase/cysteine desulfurase
VRAQAHRFVPVNEDGVWDLDGLESELRTAPTDRMRLVAIAGAYNSSGFTPPVHDAARLAHRYGAQILVDGAQLVPHRPVNMRGTGDGDHIDFLVFSAHKMYAPYGVGALVAPRDAFLDDPDELGGGIVDLVTLDRVVWTQIPDREEAGSPNVIGAVALHAAIDVLKRIGMENVARHEEALTRYAYERIATIPGFRLLGPQTHANRVGLFSVVHPEISGYKVAAILGYEFGVGVRAGCFCAHPGMIHLLRVPEGTMRSFEESILDHRNPGAVRASLGLYNSPADIDYYVHALRAIAEGRYAGEYVHDGATGDYLPTNWKPDLEAYFAVGQPRRA